MELAVITNRKFWFRKDLWLIGCWAVAEATFFVPVPDIPLSFIALTNLKRALIACGYAIVGALTGGILMYFFGGADSQTAYTFLTSIPTVSPTEVDFVQSSIHQEGLSAIFWGPLRTIPYKIFATVSGDFGVNLPLFLLISIPARGIRFLLTTYCVHGVFNNKFGRKMVLFQKRLIIFIFWLIFYMVYFTVK